MCIDIVDLGNSYISNTIARVNESNYENGYDLFVANI